MRHFQFVVSGCGYAGVIVSKYLKENDIDFLAIEQRDGIGGLWRYSDDEDVTTCTQYTITTSGKHITSFSDFQPSKQYKSFLKWSDVLESIEEYADHFKIMDNVLLNTQIQHVKRVDGDAGDRETAVNWEVSFCTHGNKSETVTCEKFIVGGGAFAVRRTPLLDKFGKSFDGEFLHSQQIKLNNNYKFRGKRILVVGGGETASDMIMHAACVSDKAIWCIPSGLHSIDRNTTLNIDGEVTELVWEELYSLKGSYTYTQHESDRPENNQHTIHSCLGANGHGVKEWICDNYYYNKFPIKDGEPLYLLHQGKITPYRTVTNIDGNVVTFDNGKKESVDMIIECEGYKKTFSYFQDNAYQEPDYEALYRNIIHVDNPNLLYLGMVRPLIGSVPCYLEVQSQYIVDVHKKRVVLPAKMTMIERIQEDQKWHKNLFQGCSRFRPDIVDTFTQYPHTLSKDMNRYPESHYSEISAQDKVKIETAPYNPGLFLWVGDSNKHDEFVKRHCFVNETVRLGRIFRKTMSVIGRVPEPMLQWCDRNVFGQKNATHLLVYGQGMLRRMYRMRQFLPCTTTAMFPIMRKYLGPFPLNHSYYEYKQISLSETTALDYSMTKLWTTLLMYLLFTMGGVEMTSFVRYGLCLWVCLDTCCLFTKQMSFVPCVVMGISVQWIIDCVLNNNTDDNRVLMYSIYALIAIIAYVLCATKSYLAVLKPQVYHMR